MKKKNTVLYITSFTSGMVIGGILFSVITNAIPKMMSGMMRNMMEGMSAEGCKPSDI